MQVNYGLQGENTSSEYKQHKSHNEASKHDKALLSAHKKLLIMEKAAVQLKADNKQKNNQIDHLNTVNKKLNNRLKITTVKNKITRTHTNEDNEKQKKELEALKKDLHETRKALSETEKELKKVTKSRDRISSILQELLNRTMPKK